MIILLKIRLLLVDLKLKRLQRQYNKLLNKYKKEYLDSKFTFKLAKFQKIAIRRLFNFAIFSHYVLTKINNY